MIRISDAYRKHAYARIATLRRLRKINVLTKLIREPGYAFGQLVDKLGLAIGAIHVRSSYELPLRCAPKAEDS